MMFVLRTTYNKIKLELSEALNENENLVNRNSELNKEVERLADIISATNTECKVGPWCADCDHMRYDASCTTGTKIELLDDRWVYWKPLTDGKVMYCAKHLHDLCPEHSKSRQEE